MHFRHIFKATIPAAVATIADMSDELAKLTRKYEALVARIRRMPISAKGSAAILLEVEQIYLAEREVVRASGHPPSQRQSRSITDDK